MRKLLRTHNIKYLVTLRAKRFRINSPLATVSLYHSIALELEIINLSIIAFHFVHYSKITSALVNTQSYYHWFPKANRTSWSFQSISIHFHRSLRYLGPKLWNDLTPRLRNLPSLKQFKNVIRDRDLTALAANVSDCRGCNLCQEWLAANIT